MGHTIRWDNEDKTVVLQEYTDGATKDDFYQLAQKSSEMLKTVRHTVHLIIDERKIDLTLDPSDLAYIKELLPENEGAGVVIVPPSKIKFKLAFLSLSKQVMWKTYANTYFVESLEEARQLLQTMYDVRYPS
jgi:hypothetical protein